MMCLTQFNLIESKNSFYHNIEFFMRTVKFKKKELVLALKIFVKKLFEDTANSILAYPKILSRHHHPEPTRPIAPECGQQLRLAFRTRKPDPVRANEFRPQSWRRRVFFEGVF